MTYDPAWDMPQLNWQQQGSFEQGSVPPTTEPTAGTQVWLGPVAREWLPHICGALDQLRNPSAWIVADDTHMYDTLRRVDTLLGLVCTGSTGCPVLVRFTSDCHLQTSCDNGTTWTTVPGWDTYLHSCIVANIPPPLPPNPGGRNPDQLACDIAGFLAQVVIQETMKQIYSLVSAGKTKDFIFTGVMAAIGIFFPEIDGVAVALNAFIDAVIAQTLTEINFVATDPTFWSKVTCAIFNAIRADGKLTASNVLTAGANILGISYPGHIWAPPAVSAYWLALGFTNLLFAQSSGAVDVVDCTSCGSYCYEWDFTASNGGWSVYTGTPGGVWVSGLGWNAAQNNRGDGFTTINVQLPISPAVQITGFKFKAAVTAGGTLQDWIIESAHSGSVTATCSNTPTQDGAYHVYSCGPFAAVAADHLYVALTFTSAVTNIVLQSVEVTGPGANPFGANNCAY